jgi:hypothetical protein
MQPQKQNIRRRKEMASISKQITREVTLTGLTSILFDRYAGDNKTQLAPEQKMYLQGKTVCLPSMNITSFLSAQNTESAPKMLLDKREYKTIASALLASTIITPTLIPFTKNGKPVLFGGSFVDDVDTVSGIRLVYHVARLDKGIPNPKVRPVLDTPWELKFKLTVLPHPGLNEDLIENLFVDGGVRLGLGTFRKAFGKFSFDWK